MTRAHVGYKLYTSIAAMMLSVTAQNALAQNTSTQNPSTQNGSGTNRGTQGQNGQNRGIQGQNGQNRGTQGQNGQTGCCTNQSSGAVDPGVRGGTPGAGGPVGGLTSAEMAFFTAAQARFEVIETVPAGLGPGFNELACANCHIAPAVGGASPTTNPQVTDANTDGATNVIPSFITANGPIREARFVNNPDGTPDGSVHNLFSTQGRSDAPGCVFAQPNFAAELAANNVIFRIPINTFGDGLVEGISDQSLLNAFNAQAQQNASLGISGTFNRSGNTANITRFGWKAQNASLNMFAGEAYNVEEGVTNDLFPDKRNFTPPATTTASPQCAPNALPEDTVSTVDTMTPPSASTASDLSSDVVNFTLYMRLLAPPTPAVPFTTSSTASTTPASTATSTTASTTASTTSASTTTATSSTTPASTATSTSSATPASSTVALASVLPAAAGTSTSTSSSAASTTTAAPSAASVTAGFQAFTNIGCSGCHIVSQTTVSMALIDTTANPTVSNTTLNTFSDYAVHSMGMGLADGVSQGNANGTQFRSAPLWGIGQRVFFLHDGRTNNLLTAIQQHASSGSEANQVITQFNMLSTTDQQNILNFLRDL
jgi:CxxC motif-containing protein (DUF1111 family)